MLPKASDSDSDEDSGEQASGEEPDGTENDGGAPATGETIKPAKKKGKGKK